MTEEEYIREQGRIPWRMNHLRPTVRNLKGQLRQNESDRAAYGIDRADQQTAEMLTVALRQVRRINRAKTIEADQFMDHLIGGRVAFRTGYTHIPQYDRDDVVIQPVNFNRLFYNPDVSDRRMWDLRLIGQIHDLTMQDILMAFAPDSRKKAKAIEEYYGDKRRGQYREWHRTGFERFDQEDFYVSADPSMCRVIEVWEETAGWRQFLHDPIQGKVMPNRLSAKEIAMENRARAEQGMPLLDVKERYETYWEGWYTTPDGHVLWHGESPYAHQEHPFVMGFAEMMDSQPAGVLDDLIDQQRLYNRMVQRIDEAIGTTAHGTLMMPEEMVPDGMSNGDFADEITRTNGIVFYQVAGDEVPKGLQGRVTPEQVNHNAIPAGAFDFLQMMEQGIRDVSGISGAALGEEPNSNTPYSLYAQQIAQSSTNTVDFFETYLETLASLDRKILSLVVQHWDERRTMRTEDGRQIQFDPEQARDIDYDVTVARVEDTAVYRQLFEQDLQQFLQQGRLTFRQFLQASSHPRADSILKLLDRTNPLSTGNPQDLPPEVQQAVASMQGLNSLADASPQEMQQVLQQAADAGSRDAAALLNQSQ